MRRVIAHIIALVALVVMVWLGSWFAQDAGYVLLQLRGWSLETTIPMLIVFIVGLAAMALIGRIMWVWPRELGRRTALNTKQKLLEQGLLGIQEGNYQKAEKALSKLADKSDSAAAFLVAAEAARENNNPDKSRLMLQKALDQGGADFTVRLKQAEWMFQEKQFQSAYDILAKLRSKKPRHEKVLKLYYECAKALGHDEEASGLHKVMLRRKILNKDQLTGMEHEAKMVRLGSVQTLAELDDLWKELSRAEKNETAVIYGFASRYVDLGEAQKAAKLLEPALKKELHPELLTVYAKVEGEGQKHRVQLAEKWLNEQPDNPVLLRSLGQMCLTAELWGKAKDYLEASLGIEPSPQAYEFLARLAESFDHCQAACRYYDNAVRVRDGNAPEQLVVWDVAEAAREKAVQTQE